MPSLSFVEPSMPNASSAINNENTLKKQINKNKTTKLSLASTAEEALDFSLKTMSDTVSVAASVVRLPSSKSSNGSFEKTKISDLLTKNQNNQSKYLNNHDNVHSPNGTSTPSVIFDLTSFTSDDCGSSTNSNSIK